VGLRPPERTVRSSRASRNSLRPVERRRCRPADRERCRQKCQVIFILLGGGGLRAKERATAPRADRAPGRGGVKRGTVVGPSNQRVILTVDLSVAAGGGVLRDVLLRVAVEGNRRGDQRIIDVKPAAFAKSAAAGFAARTALAAVGGICR